MLAEFNPIVFVKFRHAGNGGFAEVFEVAIPDGGDNMIIIIPEFALVFGAVGGDGGVARVDGPRFAVFVEEVRETDFD